MKIGIIIIVMACFLIAFQLGKPEIRSIKSEWGDINESTTEILTKVHVYNPYPVALPIKKINTEIYINDIKIGEGSAPKIKIGPRTESLIVVSTKIKNSLIPEWWVSHILNGEKSVVVVKANIVFDYIGWKYTVEMSYPVTTDILSGLNLKQAVQYSCIRMENFRLKWGAVSERYTGMRVSADVISNCPYPFALKDVYYRIELNGVDLGEGVSKVETMVSPGSKRAVTFEMRINNHMLEKWWIQHIKNGEFSTGKVTIRPLIEVVGRSFRISIEKDFDFTTNLLSERG